MAVRYDYNAQITDSLVMFLQLHPQNASAESNALSRLAHIGDDLVFLHSDTPEGAHCSAALCRYFAGLGYRTRSEKITGLAYHEQGFVSHGLRQLVRLMSHELRQAQRRGQPPVINATGGFKAEIAYATALGLMFQAPVCYMHEKFGDIVTLPASPITWDYSLFAWHSDFFDWLDAKPRLTLQVNKRLSGLPDTAAMLLEDAPDGHTYLSPLGEAYLEAFRGQQQERSALLISPAALATLQTATWENQGRYRQLIERLRQRGTSQFLSNTELVQDGIYKFPKGHSVLRVFFGERDGQTHILELCGHEDERRYQDLLGRIRWSQYNLSEFTLLA